MTDAEYEDLVDAIDAALREDGGVATVEDAQEAWENHCDVVFMEATSG